MTMTMQMKNEKDNAYAETYEDEATYENEDDWYA